MELSELMLSITGAGGGILFMVLTIIQITPIKFNPWSLIAKRLGKAINGEVISKVDRLSDELQDLRNICDERDADSCRIRILHFNDEILHDVKHSKEHFDQILMDISRYENYCDEHTHYKNHIADQAINHIKRIYQKCEDEGTFLWK